MGSADLSNAYHLDIHLCLRRQIMRIIADKPYFLLALIANSATSWVHFLY